MKLPHFTLIIGLALISAATAADIVTTKGTVYLNVKVTRTDANGISVTHSNGAAFIDFDELPSQLQSQYGWTAEKSAARNAARRVEEEKRIAQGKAAAAVIEERQRQEEKKRFDAMTVEIKEREAANRVAAEQEAKRVREKDMETLWQVVSTVLLFGAGLVVYFLPTIVSRKKRNAEAIAVLNLLAGWTFIGWIIAIVWASTKDPNEPQQPIAPRPMQPRAARPIAVKVPTATPPKSAAPPKNEA